MTTGTTVAAPAAPPAPPPPPDRLRRVRRWAWASIAVNAGIVVTGGAVRLTNSGLGCPTWPRCTDASYVTTPEMGIHGAIEFGNRTLTFVVGLVALGGLIAAWRLRPRPRGLLGLALAVLVGIGVQGVVGGITVHLELHPLVVGGHFLLSMGLLALTYAFWWRSRPPGAAPAGVGTGARRLGGALAAATLLALAVGTLVTGSGPHSGDADAARNGLDPELISKVHAASVYLLVALTVALLALLRRRGAPAGAVRAAWALLAVELAQGVLGFVQYYTGLPELLVGAHLLGACLVWLAALHARAHTRTA
ncbi:protein required for cytochrome oxidase assembly [Pilimelia anulata]|uniref:Protein required for cytochrome oxidase assembly n=1 Tax=Pilimelia anulata TaxID=53371 RepID=A0A8J3B0I9_9ACTN|nr:COX15/CtaA family protein [Pilimelia anulata]GGJ81112.1 protein required for cytochrome oxidase assembly [Pilimelia anulata]